MDWFKEIVEQFGAVSYGDSTFALFVIVPLQMYWPETYRELLFGDRSDILPFIRLTVEEVSQFIPLEQFVTPAEQNPDIISKFRSAIGGGALNVARNSFLFYYASHHVKHFASVSN